MEKSPLMEHDGGAQFPLTQKGFHYATQKNDVMMEFSLFKME